MFFSLRKKLLLSFGIILIFTAGICVLGILSLLRLGDAGDAILSENYKSILAAENMIDAIERQDSAVLLLILGYRDEGLPQFRQNESQFLQWLARAKDNITIEGEGAVLEKIESNYSRYLVSISDFITSLQLDQRNSSEFYHESVLPLFRTVRDACIDLREMNQQTMFAASDQAGRVARRAVFSLLAIGVFILAACLLLSLVLSDRLIRPIRQLTAASEKIARGDYEVSVETTGRDELGLLAREFEKMSRKLKAYHDLNVARALAEKRRSEAVIRSINDGIVLVDEEFKIIEINPRAGEFLGLVPETARGKHFLEVVKDHRLFEDLQQAAGGEEAPARKMEERLYTVTRGTAEKYYRYFVTPIRSEGGRMLGVVVLFQDITKLKELDRLKSEFIMTASHELRTPINGLAMSINLLREGAAASLTPPDRELLQAAHEDIERMRALANDLLDLSKLESGRVEMAFDRVAPAVLCEKACVPFRKQAEEKKVDLVCEVAEDLPEVKADPNKIAWVVTNLIANALRYTGSGGRIRVGAEAIGGNVHIRVADNGDGIPLESQSRIFDKFVQGQDAKTAGGTGLGLTICREIVKAHGGTIWLDSNPGQGSTFTFTLPVIKQATPKGGAGDEVEKNPDH